MNTVKKVAKNTTVLFIATLTSYTLGFFTTLYSARYLGAGGFGIISLALSLTSLFGVFADLGLSNLTVREVTREKSFKDKYILNTTLIRVILAFLTFGTLILAVNIIGYSHLVKEVIYFITFSIIFTAFTGGFSSIFQAYEKMEYQSIGTIINAVFMFLGTLLAVIFKLDILIFAAIYFLASLLTLTYSFGVYVLKFGLPKLDIDLSFWKPTIKEALPFGIAGVFVTIYYWIDSVMLSVMVGNEAVGWYNAAYKLLFAFLSLYSVYMVAIFPVMANLYKTSLKALQFSYERSFKYMLLISIPIAIGTTILSNKVILLVYGADYIPSIIALQILVWTIIFMFLNGISGNLLGSINQQLVVTKITASGAVLNILLNLVLIPKFSLVGSSVATVLTEFLILPLYLYVLLKTSFTDYKFILKDLPKIVVANITMAVYLIVSKDMNLFLEIIIGSIIYLSTLYLTKTLDEEDLSLIKSLLKR